MAKGKMTLLTKKEVSELSFFIRRQQRTSKIQASRLEKGSYMYRNYQKEVEICEELLDKLAKVTTQLEEIE